MTTLIGNLKQPSTVAYHYALKEREIPFRIRAGIINAYRRIVRNGTASIGKKNEGLLSQEALENKGKGLPEEKGSKRNKRKLPKRIIKILLGDNHGSKHNYVRVSGLKLNLRYTSGGRNRNSRKRKDHFVPVRRVFHLKGSKYNGGERWPT